MTFIYSFLQKRKMHENQHGIIMVVIAYALSVLLLVLGSDVFYNIRSAAAGTDAATEEQTGQVVLAGAGPLNEDYPSLAIRSKLLNPYGVDEMPDNGQVVPEEDSAYHTDTVWFLGGMADNRSYDGMMEQMNLYLQQMSADNTGSSETNQNAAQANITARADISLKTDASASTSDAVKTSNTAKTSQVAEKEDTTNTVTSFSVEVASSDSVITVSEEEVTMLERIVEAEAEGEDMVGKILIANVIFNRMVDEEFPDSVEEVIFQKSHGDYQFSPVDNGRYWSVDISDETVEAVQRALDGEDYSKGALYFIARKRTSTESAKWFDNNLDRLFGHGGHEFYK